MTVAERVATLDWPALEAELWERGWASTPDVLTAEECNGLIRAYGDDRLFRSRVDMGRHRFGVGDYKYFGRPLPKLVEQLRMLHQDVYGAVGFPFQIVFFLSRPGEDYDAGEFLLHARHHLPRRRVTGGEGAQRC